MFEIVDEFGHITDKEMLDLDFPADVNSEGEEVLREAGMTAENRARAKVLSHLVQRERRLALIEDKVAGEASKQAREDVAIDGVLKDNLSAEAKLFMLLAKPPTSSRNQLTNATAEHFSKLTVPLLQAFVHARQFPTSGKAKGFSWPAKGKVGEAAENLINLAHGVRQITILVLKAAEVSAVATPAVAPAAAQPRVITAMASLSGIDPAAKLPSAFLADESWLQRAHLALVGCAGDGFTGTAVGQRADQLQILLHAHLAAHLVRRIPEKLKDKRSSYVFDWARKNLAPIAAVVANFGHAKADLGVVTAQSTILANSTFFFVAAANKCEKLEGCYTHRDEQSGQWRRSGKVVGVERNFGVRQKEHARASLLLKPEDRASLFYLSYPARDCEIETGAARLGHFGNLDQFVASASCAPTAPPCPCCVRRACSSGRRTCSAASARRAAFEGARRSKKSSSTWLDTCSSWPTIS